ncbi:MAG: hypothetical protein JXQ23_01870 [Clostridia bacterium]|nr:hypothetical protein [Clostridia bacterium]
MRLMYFEQEEPCKIIPEAMMEMICDLQLDKLAEKLKYNYQTYLKADKLFSYYSNDEKLLHYRQEIFNDFYENQAVTDVFIKIFPHIAKLKELSESIRTNGRQSPLTLMKEIGWYDVYISIFSDLNNASRMFKEKLKSKTLLSFFDEVEKIYSDSEFQNIINNFEKMKLFLMEPKAVEFGVNLDELLRPDAFFLLDLKSYYYLPPILNLSGLGGKHKGHRGIGTLLYQPTDKKDLPLALSSKIQKISAVRKDPQFVSTINSFSKKMDLPFDKTATQYIQAQSGFILEFFDDLQLILGGVKYLKSLEKYHVPVTKPNICPKNEKNFSVKGIYNPFLVDSIKEIENLVLNDITLDHENNLLLLVGANKGGKTTLVQAIGLTLFLFHLGFNVPCQSADISPFDYIFTHYQKEEDFRTREGRLGHESLLFKQIFSLVNGNSFILVNEPFMTTSPMEGELLSYEVLKIFKKADANTILVSHFSSLTGKIEQLNKEVKSDGKAFCLSMGIKENDNESIRTYQLTEQIYESSYSSDILKQYGENLFDT